MKRCAVYLALSAVLFAGGVRAGEVRVAVAANFLATLQAIEPVYAEQSGDRLIISSASSGKHYAQIIHGAPYDVFLAADQHHLDRLAQTGKVVPDSRFVYARGRLVLWSAAARPVNRGSLSDAAVQRIAVANPRTAPYGSAAREALQSLGLWASLQHKLVRGESVGQAFQFVASANAELGFVALSQVLSPANRFNREYYWPVPQQHYRPLRQGAALLQSGRDNPAARRFLRFLQGDEARRVMKQYGYL